jgi:hypothetical protein
MSDGQTRALIDAGDLDGLLRHIDRLCDEEAWDDLADLAHRARAAHERGRQLWPASLHAEYRLALEAPARWAAPVAAEARDRFTIGPLSEVVASTHSWDELDPHLPVGPVRSLVAYERVLRREDLRRARDVDASVFDLPLRLERWEPTYPLATYVAWRGIFPTPATAHLEPVHLPEPTAAAVADPAATEALGELTRPWVTESNGRSDAVAVQGDAFDAIALLGVPSARAARIAPAAALELMAWAAASGGAHGRRRGMAAGRFNAWWAAAALCAMTDDWPLDPKELGEAVDELAWYAWDSDEPPTGWTFRIAAVDPADGMAWAAMANDVRLG